LKEEYIIIRGVCTLAIPPIFNEEFLLWFRARTEATWKKMPDRSVEEFDARDEEDRSWHPYWRGAKWLEPLTDEEIDAVERQWHIRFPPDYRLFFKWLHATNKPKYEYAPGEFITGLFYSWQESPSYIHHAYEHILGGFAFDAIHNSRWRSEWGPVPLTEEEAHERLKPIIQMAPKLIPIHWSAYLLVEPCQAGNPVLSIWQTDIFVSAPDLRTFLLAVFSRTVFSSGPSLLRLNSHDQKEVNEEKKRWRHQDKSMYKNISFWGDYLP
jgi:hypothetical protein